MLIACWGAKGGVGTTVTATAMAVHAARTDPAGAVIVDLAGDVPAVLGLPQPEGPGVGDWLGLGDEVPPDGLLRIETEVHPGLALLAQGTMPVGAGRADVLAAILATDRRTVVVDCGCLIDDTASGWPARCAVATAATRSLLITRACYLALRHATRCPLTPSAVVLLREPGRALGAGDVEQVIGAEVRCVVPVEAAVARAVDAGLLAARLPRVLDEALRRG